MTAIALVHGGMHGAWCWERVAPLLADRGHRVVAPDLPFEDPDAGPERWSDVVIEATLAGPTGASGVLAVGHSLGGLCLPIVASKLPVRRMVFLGGAVPTPGQPYSSSIGPRTHDVPLNFETARSAFYHDLDDATSRRAFERLRPTPAKAFTEPCPITAWPATPSTYIAMRDDRAVPRPEALRRARSIDADLVELPGGHSPFYGSVAQLVEVLDTL